MLDSWLPLVAPASLIAGAGLLFWAAIHDIIARTVPNWVAGLLALAGLGARIMGGNVLVGLIAAFAAFVIGAFCWRRGWLGGADVKLIAAATLTVTPGRVFTFLVAMSISGSILAAIYLIAGRIARRGHRPHPVTTAARHRPASLLGRAARVELWRLRRGGPLPYACAIAAGFAFLLF